MGVRVQEKVAAISAVYTKLDQPLVAQARSISTAGLRRDLPQGI